MKAFRKKIEWIKMYSPEFELVENIVLIGSGTSVDSVPKSRLEGIINDPKNLVITLNYGIKKINSDYNFITDRDVISWAFRELNDRQRSRCVVHKTNHKEWIPYTYDTRLFHGRRSSYTIVNALMAIQTNECLKSKPIWIYGLDLYVKRDKMKYYDDILPEGQDVNRFRKEPTRFLGECGADLDRCIVDKRNVYNCNPTSCYEGFEFREFK
jgi:hypothetical protein